MGEGENLRCLDGGVYVGAIRAVRLATPDGLGDDVERVPVPGQHAVVQRGVRKDVLDQQDGERADQFGSPGEAVGDLSDLVQEIASPVGVRLVIEVTRVQHRVQ